MIGRTFAHYRIVERLGADGMGEVYDETRHKTLTYARPIHCSNPSVSHGT